MIESKIDLPLCGKHLLVSGLDASIDFHEVRNASGHVLGLTGVAAEMLPWLCTAYGFTFVPLQLNMTPLDYPTGNKPGLMTYLNEGKCDILVSVTPTFSRAALADLSHPSIYIPASFLIPPPGSSVDIFAILEPFELSSWLGIIFSYLIVLIFLYCITWISLSVNFDTKMTKSISEHLKNQTKETVFAIYGLFLRQAAFRFSPKIHLRILVGAWCLVAFILVNYYTTLLTSFVAAPNQKPLIKSIYDLRNRPDIRFVSNRDRNTAALLLSADSGFYKELGDRLRADPQSLCASNRDCMNLLKSSTKTVYSAGRDGTLLAAMLEDFQATGKCNAAMGKEHFLNLYFTWALQKKSPYTDSINKGIIRMRQAGLLSKWYIDNRPDPRQCLDDNKGNSDFSPLTLEELTGAFIALFTGYVLALLFFVGERIISSSHNKIDQHQ